MSYRSKKRGNIYPQSQQVCMRGINQITLLDIVYVRITLRLYIFQFQSYSSVFACVFCMLWLCLLVYTLTRVFHFLLCVCVLWASTSSLVKGFSIAPRLLIICPVPPLPRGCSFIRVAITVVKPPFRGLQCCLPLKALSWSIVCWLYLSTHLMC